MDIIVFEDSQVAQLMPLTLGRAAYSLQCGGLCLADWLTLQRTAVRGVVRPHLAAWQAAEYPQLDMASTPSNRRHQPDNRLLMVNARLVPCQAAFVALQSLMRGSSPCIIRDGEAVVACVVPANDRSLSLRDVANVSSFLRSPEISGLEVVEQNLPLFRYPSDLIHEHMQHFASNLQHRIQHGAYREVRDGVFVAGTAKLADSIDIDTRHGPIVIGPGVSVQPFACLRGPLYLAAMSRVNEHALLKPGVHLGTLSKVGGEVEASVIEAFSNKQHLGYLGHSYLGRWVNLGAGTSNSNLKNTYGSIRIEVEGQRVDTGLQFMGCVIGDFTKTAINTAIFTGKLIGCCSMVYGFVTTNVPSFANYARSFGEVTEQSPDVVAATQKRVFLRRGIEQQRWHVELLEAMHRIVSTGRQLADRPVSL